MSYSQIFMSQICLLTLFAKISEFIVYQPEGEIPRKPPAVTSTPSSSEVSSPADRLQARRAQAGRQLIREEAERGPTVAMTNRDMDSVFPEDRFTLISAEPNALDYE